MKEGYCKELVTDSSGWHTTHCSKKAVTADGYCKIHDPAYIEAKNKERMDKYYSLKCKTEKCGFNFKGREYYTYCPFCGTKR